MNWNSDQVISDTIEWDVSNWSKALPFWSEIIQEFNPKDTKVLCLGERNGGLSLWFALRGFTVVCSDFHGSKESAKALHKRYQVANLIEYADVNIFDIPFPDDSFDIVTCKSVIGGLKLDYNDKRTRTLENQKLALHEVRRVLRLGGVFCGAENMRGSWLHRSGRKLLKGDKIGWRHLCVSELRELVNDFTYTRFRFFGFLGSYYQNKFINRISSGMDNLLSRILPDNWLYIGFIVARK